MGEPRSDENVIDLTPVDQFRRLVALIADGIVVVDNEGKVRLVNPAAEELLGRPGRDLIGQMFGFPIVAGDSTDIEIMRHDRSSVVVQMRVAEIEWDGAQGVVASLRDVTEHAQLVDDQERSIERLRELDEMKTEFVSMVSHDLRSPMATISGFADTLRYNWSAFDDEHKLKILERISRNTNQLAKLVENILQVSQIESGKLSYEIGNIDMRDLVHRVVDENTQPLLDSVERNIELQMPDDLPEARADEIRQWQILTNLVTNALKFSPEEQPIEVGVSSDSRFITVSVTDHGIGIKEEDEPKLFQKFSRLEQPQGLKIKGTGLGLYICKAMIEAQGGRIWVESVPGRGATFTYTVPVAH